MAQPQRNRSDAGRERPTPSTLSRLRIARERDGKPAPTPNEVEGDGVGAKIAAEPGCDLVRGAVEALAGLDPKPVRHLIGATPRGLQRRRQIAMYLAHTALGIRAGDVARLFGRDSTTVYHAFRQVEDLRDDPSVDGLLDAVETVLVALVDSAKGANEAANGQKDGSGAEGP